MNPTKAEKEFDGDCFGTLHDEKASACLRCAVAPQCSVQSLLVAHAEITIPFEDEALQICQTPSIGPYEGGFLKGSGAHLAWKAILAIPNGEFHFDGLYVVWKRLLLDAGIELTSPKKTLEKVVYKMLGRNELQEIGHRRYRIVRN